MQDNPHGCYAKIVNVQCETKVMNLSGSKLELNKEM